MRRYTFIMPLHQPIVDVLKYISQELRDISTMAMDHFDDKIVPTLKLSSLSSGSMTPSKYQSPVSYLTGFPASIMSAAAAATAGSPGTPYHHRNPGTGFTRHPALQSLSDELLAISKKVSSLVRRDRRTQKQMATYKQALEDQNKKITDQNKKIADLNKKITQLEKCLGEQDVVSKDQESKIAELTRKLAEFDHKQNDYLPTSMEQ